MIRTFSTAPDQSDAHHDAARDILLAVDGGDMGAVHVSNYVVAETLSLTHSRLGHDIALGLLERINDNSNIRVDHAPQQDYHGAMEASREYEDLSFVDASTVALMQRAGVETLYSFDTDFDSVQDLRRAESV